MHTSSVTPPAAPAPATPWIGEDFDPALEMALLPVVEQPRPGAARHSRAAAVLSLRLCLPAVRCVSVPLEQPRAA